MAVKEKVEQGELGTFIMPKPAVLPQRNSGLGKLVYTKQMSGGGPLIDIGTYARFGIVPDGQSGTVSVTG